MSKKNNGVETTAVVGIFVSLAVFFVALFYRNNIPDSNLLLLVYPISMLSAFFFVGYVRSGTVLGGIRDGLVIFGLILIAALLSRLSSFL